MSTKAAPLGLRLFLEGVEVPVISANVSVQPDMPATAAIQIIPTDTSLYFLPRTLTHLFYLDSYLTDAEVEAAKKVVDKTRTSPAIETNDMDRYEMSGFSYKLLFTGEVIGLNYRKTPSGRQMVLQCMDLSSYWDTCYQWFADYSAGGNGLTDHHHQFVGAGSGKFDNFGGHQWVISQLINHRPKTPEYKDCAGLLGGLIHLLEAVGGVRFRNSSFKGYKGVNDFFTIAELRYNLLGQLGAIAADKTSAKLYASKAFNAWLRNGMTSMGNLVSFRDMLNHINRLIYHNIYPNPCPKYQPSSSKTKRVVKVSTTTFLDAPSGPGIKSNLDKILTSMAITRSILDTAANAAEPEDFELNRSRRNLLDIWEELRRNIGLVDASKGSNAATVSSSLKEISSDIREAIDTLPINPSEGNVVNKTTDTLDIVTDAYGKLYDLMNKDIASRKVSNVTVLHGDYLYNQLFLPETFFVAPPRCNIIFPDTYFELNFSRNFLREVSRLAQQAGLGMLAGGRQGAQLFSNAYLAPPIKDVKGKLMLASMSQGARVVLPHEVHSGIIPKFEWITDGHRWASKAQKGKVEKVHYLQRLANFQFFLHRWSARQLQVSGVFNPNIVAGLPAVIIDRSSPAPVVVEMLEKMLGRRMLPTQFVAKVFNYTHSIGQQGGTTAIQFAYARTHRGMDDEFLGILSKEAKEEVGEASLEVHPRELAIGLDPSATNEEQQSSGSQTETDKAKSKQKARTALRNERRKTVVRMHLEKKLKVGIVVPGLGKVKRVKASSDQVYLTKSMADQIGVDVEYFKSNQKYVTNREAGTKATVATLAGVAVIEVPESISVTYVQLRGSGRYERTGKAFEDIVRPGWFSEDVWDNKNITAKVYQPLLGTMAITDDTSLGQEQQDEMLKRWKEDQTVRINKEDTTDASGAGTTQVESAGDNMFKYTVVKGSVEETIDGLSLLYSVIKERGGDIHEFIREYTRRPIANMVDVLGTQNLEFNADGTVKDPNLMIEGFHSRAYGDYNTDVQLPEKEGGTTKAGLRACANLMEGVADPASLPRPGLIGRDVPPTGLRPELDPRGRARGRVRLYVEELRISRGLLGS